MKKIKKLISGMLSILLIITTSVGGTYAYEAWTAREYAEKTNETLKVELVQLQRGFDSQSQQVVLEPFTDNKELLPLVDSVQYNGENFDDYGMPVADGYVDHIIQVKNTGTADAYVRVVVAVPSVLDNSKDAGANALHWNLGNRFMPNGNFGADNCENRAFADISWSFAQTCTINGDSYNLYIFTYNTSLPAGHTTDAACITGFYLDRNVDITDGKIILNGVDTGYSNDNVQIYVATQAVQAYGFASAAEAFATSETPANPFKQTTTQ